MKISSGDNRFDKARQALGTVDDIMEKYGHDRERDGFYICPWHDERTGSFHTVPGTDGFKWKCFSCQESGDSVDLEARLSGREVSEVLADVAPAEAPEITIEKSVEGPYESVFEYMHDRGITDVALIENAKLHWDMDRVWFPWIDYDGKEVYASGRTVVGDKKKYINSGGARPPMYPSPGAWLSEAVVLVEGQIDALAAEQGGVSAFATGTSVLLEAGVPILASKAKVIIVADADAAGGKWREDVIEKLQGRVALWEAKLPAGTKDLADVSALAVQQGTDPGKAVAAVLEKATEIRPRFSLWTLNQLAARPVPDDLVKGVLTANSFAVLYGPSGHGKTFVTLDLALSVATGMEWLGMEVKQGPVIYVAAEGMFGIAKRVQAWKELHHVSDVENFWVVPVAVNLLTPEIEEFGEVVAGLPTPPALIIFDTMARSMVGGDENSAKDMGRAIAGLDSLREATGSTILVVHHTGKNPRNEERGSSALRGAADTMLKVRMEDTIVMFHEKAKEHQPIFPVHMKLVPKSESVAIQRTYAGYNS